MEAKRERGRPRNPTRSAPVSLLIPAPEKRKMQEAARLEGLSLAAWIRRLALQGLRALAA